MLKNYKHQLTKEKKSWCPLQGEWKNVNEEEAVYLELFTSKTLGYHG